MTLLAHLPDTPIVSREWFGANGWSNYRYGGVLKGATAHLIREGTVQEKRHEKKSFEGDSICVTGLGLNNHHINAAPVDEWLRTRHWHNDCPDDWPMHFCPKCWRALHIELGLPVPPQPEVWKPTNGYEYAPPRELVNHDTGERWTPYVIMRKVSEGGRHHAWEGYNEKALKADGTPTWNYRGKRALIGADWGGGGWSYYDEGLELEAHELRTEIAMHQRKEKEARALLAALYKEAGFEPPEG